MKRWGTRVIVGGVLIASIVTGCSSNAEPTATPSFPTATPLTTPTPTPTPTGSGPPETIPPERPDLGAPNSTSADALARYYLQLFPYGFATGDLADWNLLSHPECNFCAGVRSDVEHMVANGQHSEGGLLHIEETSTVEVHSTWWHSVVHLVQDPSVTKDAGGAVVEAFPETKRLRLEVAMTLHDGRLVVREVDVAREG